MESTVYLFTVYLFTVLQFIYLQYIFQSGFEVLNVIFQASVMSPFCRHCVLQYVPLLVNFLIF